MIQFASAIEQSLLTQNWYSALAMSLLLPDICGKIDNPTWVSQKRYVEWYEKWLQPTYTDHGSSVILSGADCYALRCALTHEGSSDISQQRAATVLTKFIFCAPSPGFFIHCNCINDTLQLQVDVFAEDVCKAVKNWHAVAIQDPARAAAMAELLTIHEVSEGIPGLISFGV